VNNTAPDRGAVATPVRTRMPNTSAVAAWLADSAPDLRARRLERAAAAVEAVSAVLATLATGGDLQAAERALDEAMDRSFIDQADWGGYLACAAIVNTLDAALTEDPEEPELRTSAEKHLAQIAQREPDIAARWRRVLALR
jgi:hypothetical protein